VHAGELIRQRRKELGLSGHELARLAHVNQGHLSRVETGQVPLSTALAAQVARVLGLKLTELLEADQDAGEEAPAEDLVQQIRAILIRGRWSPVAREGLINLAKATRPTNSSDDGFVNANNVILTGAR
jgi:transcriptional regulator with XRE-family HTH domain